MSWATKEDAATACGSDDGLGLIDLARYPIDQTESPRLKAVIGQVREDLRKDGCGRLPGFIREAARARLAQETMSLALRALHSTERYTPYGTGPDEGFPLGHPRRRAHRTTSGSVTRDLIPMETAIQRLYGNSHLQRLVAACLEIDAIYQFADPMRGLIINTMDVGASLGWHFDTNEFIVSLMTRRAEIGGLFEYSPDIRAPGEENYEAVKSVLDGARGLVKALDLQIGDLQIFMGRYSLHRVKPVVKGNRDTIIFGYARRPGFIGSVASTMRVYGRVMPEHLRAENRRHDDGLAD